MTVKVPKIKKFLNKIIYIEYFPKLSFSETHSKISLQTQIPNLRFFKSMREVEKYPNMCQFNNITSLEVVIDSPEIFQFLD
jgi:hypothetical protein